MSSDFNACSSLALALLLLLVQVLFHYDWHRRFDLNHVVNVLLLGRLLRLLNLKLLRVFFHLLLKILFIVELIHLLVEFIRLELIISQFIQNELCIRHASHLLDLNYLVQQLIFLGYLQLIQFILKLLL